MSVELLIVFFANQFMILAFGIALWVGGWWAVRDFRRHMNKCFDQVDKRFDRMDERFDRLDEGFRRLADEIRGLTRALSELRVEVVEFRGEMRARLDGRTLSVPPASGQG